jgi:hypothetical protein
MRPSAADLVTIWQVSFALRVSDARGQTEPREAGEAAAAPVEAKCVVNGGRDGGSSTGREARLVSVGLLE